MHIRNEHDVTVHKAACTNWLSNSVHFQQIEALSEVVGAVADGCEVYLDGGIRTGTDVLKALSLGAKGVFLGRPVLWGLAHSVSDLPFKSELFLLSFLWPQVKNFNMFDLVRVFCCFCSALSSLSLSSLMQGENGVKAILELLRREFDAAMGLSGCANVNDITQHLVVHRNYYSKL